jgi:YHS domain-containing protein
MLGWLLRLILLFVILRAIYLLLRGVWRGIVEAARVPADEARPVKGTLVQDPVCGTFVVRERALSARSGGETQYFCSEDCRRQYEARSA